MSENTQKESVAGNAINKTTIAEMLAQNFEKLPDGDRKLFLYGPVYLGGNAALTGLISNSLYRRALNVTKGAFTSSLPMAVLPFMTTVALYNAAVSSPLLSGTLNCPTCALTRGALVGLIGAGVYPIFLALPVNLGLAARYNTSLMPEKGNQLRYMVQLSRPILRKMRAVLVLQVVFATYLSSRHFDTYTKVAEMSFGSDGEEMMD